MKVSIESAESLKKLISDSKIPTVERIVYMDYNDFKYYGSDDTKSFFVTLKDGIKIIGVARLGYFSLSAKSENDYSVSYFSIDKDYRYKGLARLMCDELFKYAKTMNFDISTSQYTVLGKNQLEKLFLEYSSKYDVPFRNNEGMHDYESMYAFKDGKMFRKDEV